MRTSANVIANFVNKFWGFISLYLFSKIFLNLLGAELYGMLSFYTLLYGIAVIADAGISAVLNREFARSQNDTYLRQILVLFERIYLGISLAVGFIIVFCSSLIASKWLSYDQISPERTTRYVQIIGVVIATQLMSSIYMGALMGRRQQVWANGVQLGTGIFKTVGGVILLTFYTHNLQLFLIWQIIGNLGQTFILRKRLFRFLSVETPHQRIKIADVSSELWKYLGGMTLVAILSAITIQSDKLVASKYLELSYFAFYTLASVLSQVGIFIVSPVTAAIFPVLVRSFSSGDHNRLYKTYKNTSFFLLTVISSICAVLCFFGEDLFNIWLSSKNTDTAPDGLPVLIILLSLGNTLQAAQYMPFQLLMAYGKTKFTIYQATAELLFLLPALPFFISLFGLPGIAIPWLVVKLSGYLYLAMVIKRLKPQNIHIGHLRMLVQPMLISILLNLAVYLSLKQVIMGSWTTLLICGATVAASCLLNLYLFNRRIFSRATVRDLLKG